MTYYDPSAKTVPALRYKYIANVFRLMLIGQKLCSWQCLGTG